MTSELRRPKKGDNPFFTKSKDYYTKTWVNIAWFRSFPKINTQSHIADAFKESGDIIINDLKINKYHSHPDKYFFPIAYLYRHAIELKLKCLIKIGIDLGLLTKDNRIIDSLKKHELYKLWNYAKEAIVKFWPDGTKSDLQIVESIIQQLHNIDPSGQNLRYIKNISGENTLEKMPDSIELLTFQEVIDGLYNFLKDCQFGFEAEEEARANWDNMY